MSHTYKAEAIEELLADNARLESQNQALQERAEKAEASLSEIYELRRVWDAPTNLFWKAVGIAHAALSPTQETDPE